MTAAQVVGVASALTVAVLVIAVIAVSWALGAGRPPDRRRDHPGGSGRRPRRHHAHRQRLPVRPARPRHPPLPDLHEGARTPMNLVFLDTETSGLNPQRCEIWEIGAIVRDKGRDVEYAWQIRPDLADAEPTGLRIGRYYQRSLVTRAQPGEAWKLVHPNHEGDSEREPLRWTNVNMLAAELAEILDGAYLIGAVPWFDERFLQRFLSNNGQAATNHYHLIDVETLAAGALRWNPPWDFDKILNAYDLRYDEAERHTALGDARMARDLYDAVIEGTR